MRREEPLGEDAEPSILIHSLFARHQPHVLWMPPQDGSSNISHIIQLQNHHITIKSWFVTRKEIEIDGTFPRLVSIVQKSSLMHLSNHEMKKVSRLCNWLESQRSWVAINPKVFAKLHLWWKQVTASWHTNLYHAVPQWYTMVYQLHTYSCILYHNMSKKILWQTTSKYSQNVLKYGIVARHTLSMHFRNYVFNVTPR